MERTAQVVFKRSDGRTFDIRQFYEIATMTGFDRLDNAIFTKERGQGQGEIKTGSRIVPRQPALQLTCEQQAYESVIRDITSKFFNDSYSYKIYVTYNNTTRWLNDAYLSIKDLPTANVYKKQRCTLSFLCLDPYYHSVDSYDQNIANVEKTFGWPTFILQDRANLQTPSGVHFGNYSKDRNVTIINDGDYPSWFTATIKANTDVTDFKLMQDDETFVMIKGKLKKGTIAKIDFEEKSLYIKENEITGFVRQDKRISRDSLFFEIPIGESVIKYDARIGVESIDVTLTRYINYSGI